MKFVVDVMAAEKYKGIIETAIKEAVFEAVGGLTEVHYVGDSAELTP